MYLWYKHNKWESFFTKHITLLMSSFTWINHLANLLRDSNKNIHFVVFMLISFLCSRANIVSILGAEESICHRSSICIPPAISYSVKKQTTGCLDLLYHLLLDYFHGSLDPVVDTDHMLYQIFKARSRERNFWCNIGKKLSVLSIIGFHDIDLFSKSLEYSQ